MADDFPIFFSLRERAYTGRNTRRYFVILEFQLTQYLLNNGFNIRVVSFHVLDLILQGNPGINTSIFTDEQITLAGSRYNRGTGRRASDSINSIHEPIDSPTREHSEYGRRRIIQ